MAGVVADTSLDWVELVEEFLAPLAEVMVCHQWDLCVIQSAGFVSSFQAGI